MPAFQYPVRLGPAAASAATCQAWTGGPQPPSPGNGSNNLTGVAVVSACKPWAVGTDVNNGNAETLIERWNGAASTVVPSTDPGDLGNTLFGVRALSATNAWAVGITQSVGTAVTAMILHRNGSRWSVVPSPACPAPASCRRCGRCPRTTCGP